MLGACLQLPALRPPARRLAFPPEAASRPCGTRVPHSSSRPAFASSRSLESLQLCSRRSVLFPSFAAATAPTTCEQQARPTSMRAPHVPRRARSRAARDRRCHERERARMYGRRISLVLFPWGWPVLRPALAISVGVSDVSSAGEFTAAAPGSGPSLASASRYAPYASAQASRLVPWHCHRVGAGRVACVICPRARCILYAARCRRGAKARPLCAHALCVSSAAVLVQRFLFFRTRAALRCVLAARPTEPFAALRLPINEAPWLEACHRVGLPVYGRASLSVGRARPTACHSASVPMQAPGGVVVARGHVTCVLFGRPKRRESIDPDPDATGGLAEVLGVCVCP